MPPTPVHITLYVSCLKTKNGPPGLVITCLRAIFQEKKKAASI
ncbi:hypothetical protein ApDm4_2510 [Acetobacter pomorum]|nr:hypothetical protein ApDm4_2510 [Acetobacter pomorum]